MIKVISEPKEDSNYAWKSNFVLPLEVGVVIAVLSYLISYLESFFRRGRGSHSLWCALGSEIKFCSELADLYISDNVKASNYRLPTSAYDNLFPRLLETNEIHRDEMSHLQKFYTAVNSINRGLEKAAEHGASTQGPLPDPEHERLLKRVRRIASKDGEYSVALQKILRNRGAWQ